MAPPRQQRSRLKLQLQLQRQLRLRHIRNLSRLWQPESANGISASGRERRRC